MKVQEFFWGNMYIDSKLMSGRIDHKHSKTVLASSLMYMRVTYKNLVIPKIPNI